MVNLVGQQVGNYRLTRFLGQGGFADVYLGQHIYLDTQVAIKVLQGRMTQQDIYNFKREAQTIAALNHIHILRVLDFGVERATPFLIMEYAPKGTLRDRHPHGSLLPMDTILTYLKQISSALQYAHKQKIIHRDIKPENMLIGTNDQLLLSDFGLALIRQSSCYQSNEGIAGTAAYMAPEQLQGKPRRASDQYALGVVIYEWLCGERPFQGSFTEIASQHLFTPPPPLRQKVPAIPPEVEQVVLKALAKEPHARFSSIEEFTQALEQACKQREVSAIPTPANHLFEHRRKIVLGLGLAGLTLIGGTTWIMASHVALRIPPHVVSPPFPTSIPAPSGPILSSYDGHSGASVSDVTWSPDGKSIASASLDSTVQISNAATGEHIYTYRTKYALFAVAWSPNGKWIASGGADQKVSVWNATTGKDVYVYDGQFGHVTTIAWSPDNKWIASGTAMEGKGEKSLSDHTVKVWNATTGDIRFSYSVDSKGTNEIAWSPNGKWIASSDDKTVQVRDVTTGDHVYTYHGHTATVVTLAWSPDSTRIVSSDQQTIHAWNAIDGGKPNIYNGLPQSASWLTWSPNGKWIASCNSNDIDAMQVWNAITGEYYAYPFNPNSNFGSVFKIAWSPEGKRIAQVGNGPVQVLGVR